MHGGHGGGSRHVICGVLYSYKKAVLEPLKAARGYSISAKNALQDTSHSSATIIQNHGPLKGVMDWCFTMVQKSK